MEPDGQRRVRRRSIAVAASVPAAPPRRTGIRVVVTDERGRPADAGGLGRWLAQVAPARTRGNVNVALVSDGTVRALNRRYRNQNYATDVLSFPAADAKRRRRSAGRTPTPHPRAPGPFLGDIVISRGVAGRQARALGHGEHVELRVLALHGLLHLLGYDHERDNGTMARIERRLRRKGGLGQGLIER